MGKPHSFCYVHGALHFAIAKGILAIEQAEAIFYVYFFFISSFGIIFHLGTIEKADQNRTSPSGSDGVVPVYFLPWYVSGGKKEPRLAGKHMGKERGGREREREPLRSEAWPEMNTFEPEIGSRRVEEGISL